MDIFVLSCLQMEKLHVHGLCIMVSLDFSFCIRYNYEAYILLLGRYVRLGHESCRVGINRSNKPYPNDTIVTNETI